MKKVFIFIFIFSFTLPVAQAAIGDLCNADTGIESRNGCVAYEQIADSVRFCAPSHPAAPQEDILDLIEDGLWGIRIDALAPPHCLGVTAGVSPYSVQNSSSECSFNTTVYDVNPENYVCLSPEQEALYRRYGSTSVHGSTLPDALIGLLNENPEIVVPYDPISAEPSGGGDSGTFSCQWDGTSCVVSSADSCEDGFGPSEGACNALSQSQCETESIACRASAGNERERDRGGPVSLGLAERVYNFYNYALGLGVLLALGVILYGGLAYSASGGNPSRITEAKEWIKHAVFGLILLFSIFIFLQFLNPDLLNLQEILLETNPDLIVSDIPAIEGNAVRNLGELMGGIVVPSGLGENVVDGYYQLPNSSDGAYIRGSQGGADASCGKRELITVIHAVAQAWKIKGGSPLVVRDLNGGILNSGVNHSTHDRGVDVDIDVSNLDSSERIELAKLFVDTNMVTGIIHSNLTVMNSVNTYFRLKDNGVTPWKGGDFMRWLDNSNGEPTHTSHFHVRIGDGDGASGTGINPGPCNTSCTRNTTCNPDAQLIGNAGL